MSRVRVCVGPADAVMDVERPHVETQRAQHVPQQVESAPPDTRQVTAPPGGINPCADEGPHARSQRRPHLPLIVNDARGTIHFRRT